MKTSLREIIATAGLAGVFVTGLGAVHAADLAVKAPVLKAPPPAYSWTGCYAGGFVGYAAANDWNVTDINGVNPGGVSSFPFTVGSQATGGATVGCNWQPVSMFVLGVEGEGGYLNVAGNVAQPQIPGSSAPFGTVGEAAKIGSGYGLIAARAGVAFDRLLIYGKLGVAVYDTSASVTAGDIVASGSKSQSPLAVGLGGEYAIYDHWSGKAEWVMFERGSSFDVCATAGACWKQDPSTVQTFKVGLNYKW